MDKKELIKQIIQLEWAMFTAVENVGGTASCQKDQSTFQIMRQSQAEAWTLEILESYLDDLEMAGMKGRNLMTEKYARMMAYTDPEAYDAIKDRLPTISSDLEDMIEAIVTINTRWQDSIASRYPNLKSVGRKTNSYEDSKESTSVMTYLRGELGTYSRATIKLIYKYTVEQEKNKVNLAELIAHKMVEFYGYKTLEEADERIGR